MIFEELQKKAYEIGYHDIGVCPAEIPQEDVNAYLQWLKGNNHGDLHYMENQMRTKPQELFEEAKTAVIFITHYKQPKLPFEKGKGLIASYARGRDYHHLHRSRLKQIIRWLESYTGKKNIARGFSDSAPILEKALAVQAGLGWFGKNTLLIHRKFGTFTLLSGLLTSLEIPATSRPNSRLPRCGSCTRCLDACPTGALTSPYILNASQCLSYHTIESKKPLPHQIQKNNPGYAFGCDICQDVCPHNVRPPLSHTPDFQPHVGVGTYLNLEQLAEIEQDPKRLFGTPLKRRGTDGLKHTVEKIVENQVSN